MTAPDSQRCKARSTRRGDQCKNYVVPGLTVCHYHGGATRASRAAGKRRIEECEALLVEEATSDPDRPVATPAEMLLHAAASAHAVVALMEKRGLPESTDRKTLRTYGDWLDRLSKSARSVVSSKADELVIAQQMRVAEGQAREMMRVLNAVLEALDLQPEQVDKVPGAVALAMHSLGLLPQSPATQAPEASPLRQITKGRI